MNSRSKKERERKYHGSTDAQQPAEAHPWGSCSTWIVRCGRSAVCIYWDHTAPVYNILPRTMHDKEMRRILGVLRVVRKYRWWRLWLGGKDRKPRRVLRGSWSLYCVDGFKRIWIVVKKFWRFASLQGHHLQDCGFSAGTWSKGTGTWYAIVGDGFVSPCLPGAFRTPASWERSHEKLEAMEYW